jgi:hypothetical protein
MKTKAKSEVFKAMTIQVVVFWVEARCSDVAGHQLFKRSLHTEDGNNMVLENVGILSYHYTASEPRRS